MPAECIECHATFDEKLGFCPRCGGQKRMAAAPARTDAARRRIQMAGLLHVVLGGFLLVISGILVASVVLAPDALLDQLGTQSSQGLRGGTLDLNLTQAGAPWVTDVRIYSGSGLLLHEVQSDATGHVVLNVTEAAIRIVVLGPPEINATAFVLEGSHLRLDLAAEGPAPSPWQGAQELMAVTQGLAWAMLAAGILLFASGVAAVRVRYYGLALGGALPIAVLAGLLALATLNIGSLLAFGLLVASLAIIVKGRRAFP